MLSQKRPQISLVFLIIVSLLGCCMEIDLSVPSFPSIMAYFGASEIQVQNTLSLNFLAFCISGLLYGPLSESWGRRGLMLFGATCFLVGATGCVFSHSIYELMFWRFVQGLGASSTLVLGFAMISDRYSGDVAARHIGKINAYVTIFTAAAPILGSMIVYYFTWQVNFMVIAMIALFAWILLALGLPETKAQTQSLNVKQIFTDYKSILSHREFQLYALMPNMLVTAYLTFVGSAAFYYMNTCKLPVLVYALHQGLLVGFFSLTSFNADKVVKLIGSSRAVLLGMLCSGIGTVLFILFAFVVPTKPTLVTGAICLCAVGAAFPMSVTFAQSLEIIPSLKGACSSFIMSSRLLLSSVAVMLTGVFFDGSMRPVALINATAIAIAFLCYFAIEKSKQNNVAMATTS